MCIVCRETSICLTVYTCQRLRASILLTKFVIFSRYYPAPAWQSSAAHAHLLMLRVAGENSEKPRQNMYKSQANLLSWCCANAIILGLPGPTVQTISSKRFKHIIIVCIRVYFVVLTLVRNHIAHTTNFRCRCIRPGYMLWVTWALALSRRSLFEGDLRQKYLSSCCGRGRRRDKEPSSEHLLKVGSPFFKKIKFTVYWSR